MQRDSLLEQLRAALEDRYAVEREIGSGGMASVYLAQDTKHHRSVAIKVLAPELAAVVGSERFLREIEIAGRLAHPHILPVHDSGSVEGFLYYVMPYVSGESLRATLEREEQLPLGDAVRIAREVADALAFAHAEGVLHRDVKPENILLEAGHAVLADFGIAKAVAEGGSNDLTRTGVSPGTPAYMSPEQAGGNRQLDGRSDVYSLGCVLYEMLTGEPPYTGPSAQAVLARKMTEPLPGVRNVRDTVSDDLERVVHKALARIPADRYGTAAELGAALVRGIGDVTGDRPGRMGPGVTRQRSSRKGVRWVAAAVVAGAGILAAGYAVLSRQPVAEQDVVAVFRFEDLAGDSRLDRLGTIVAHHVTSQLSLTDEVQAVDYGTVSDMLEASGNGGTERGVAAELGAGTMITGTYRSLGDTIALRAQITRVADARVMESVEVRGPRDEPMKAVGELAQRVAGLLAVSLDPDTRAWGYRPNYAAYQAFMMGIELFASENYASAIPHFERAYRADTTFATALMYVGTSYGNTGRTAQADSVFKILEPRKDGLLPSDRLNFEWHKAIHAGDLTRQLEAARSLYRRDAHQFGPWLGLSASRSGLPSEALQALESVRRNSLQEKWIGHWASLTMANHLAGRYEAELEAAHRGREIFPSALGLRFQEVRALVAMDQLERIGPLLDEVEGLQGGAWNPGGVFFFVTLELDRHEHPKQALEMAERAVAWFETWGPLTDWSASSTVLIRLERFDEALEIIDSEIEERPNSPAAWGLRGIAMAGTGDKVAAEEAANRLGQMKLPYQRGANTYWRAAVLAHLDRKDEAVRLLDQAMREGWGFDLVVMGPNDLRPLLEYGPYRELVRPKG